MADKNYDSILEDELVELYLKSIGAGEFQDLSGEEQDAAIRKLEALYASEGPEFQNSVQESMTRFLARNASDITGRDTSLEDMRKMYRTEFGGQIATALAGAGISVAQLVKGNKILKSAELAKFPEYEKSAGVDNRINELRQLIEQGSPEQVQGIQKAAADLTRVAEARAGSSGQVGDFLALSQAGDLSAAEMKRRGLGELANARLARETALDRMTQLQMADNQFAHQAQVQKFTSLLYPEYTRKITAGEGLVNAGVTNLFGSLNAATQAAPMFQAAQSLSGRVAANNAVVPPVQYGRTGVNQTTTAPAPGFALPADFYSQFAVKDAAAGQLMGGSGPLPKGQQPVFGGYPPTPPAPAPAPALDFAPAPGFANPFTVPRISAAASGQFMGGSGPLPEGQQPLFVGYPPTPPAPAPGFANPFTNMPIIQ